MGIAADIVKLGLIDGAPAGTEKAALAADASEAFATAFKTPVGDVEKSVASPLRPLVQALMGSAGGYANDLMAIQKVLADLGKEITLTSPLSSSFAVYDLQAPAKKIFPVLSPFRNSVPRVPGEGTAVHWKQISAISGSGGANASLSPFIAELPQLTQSGVTLNLPPELSYTASDQSVSYAAMGRGSSASMIAQIAARGYQDLRELAALSTLQSLMMDEDRAMWSARSTGLGAPTVSAAAQTPSTGFTALTGITTNVFVKATQVTMLGESAGSSSASSAAPSGAQDVLVTITPVTTNGNAEAFNVYASTGSADPGDGSRFFQGSTGYNKFELGGAFKTSGATVPTTDTTNQSNGFAGLFDQLEGGTTFYNKALNAALGLADIDQACVDRYVNFKAHVQELWMGVNERRRVKDQVLNNGTNASGYRLELGQNGQIVGLEVSAVLNPASNQQMPINVEPWFKNGSVVGISKTLPFPVTNIPNVWEMKLPQDYLAIDWPVIDMNYRNSVIAYGALIGYAPDFNFWLRGIQNAYGAGTNAQ